MPLSVVTEQIDIGTKSRDSLSSLKKATSDDGSRRSLKSTLFGVRRKNSKGEEETRSSTSIRKQIYGEASRSKDNATVERIEEERSTAISRLYDDESSFQKRFLKTRKPQTPLDSKSPRGALPRRPGTPKQTKGGKLDETRDEAENKERRGSEFDERSDWDKPIEQNRDIGRQAVKGTVASHHGRDDDSWSLGSMLSLKRFRNNRKQSEPENMDKILGTHIKARHEEDGGNSLAGSIPSHSPSVDSISNVGAQPKKSGLGKSRPDFPKPYVEYHENEKTWVIGNQWRQNGNGEKDKMLHVYDNKQRVHVVNCHGVNIHIHGRKMKAVLVDSCSDINVIFDSVITTCEVVNCSHVGLQVTGLCPTFSIDATEGVTVWLTREAMETTNFVTSKSSRISISVPQSDDDHPWERKEVPLPAQYVHKFQNGGVMSHLPGKY